VQGEAAPYGLYVIAVLYLPGCTLRESREAGSGEATLLNMAHCKLRGSSHVTNLILSRLPQSPR
jgi:hypothetical protein